jgi:hypothetical protein
MNFIPKKCKFDSCENNVHAKDMCQSHYRKEFRKQDSGKEQCLISECKNPKYSKGMCAKHYQNNRLQGNHTSKICSLESCNSKQYAKGYCYSHYSIIGKYNIHPEQYEKMNAEQLSKCFICGFRSDRLHIDHCHDTGIVRKLLCSNCNTALGLMKENKENILKLINYLDKYGVE